MEADISELKKYISEKYRFRTELHAHTSPVSSCADFPPEEVIRRYAAIGYDAIAVTNHFTYGYRYERFDKECMNIPIFKYYDSYQMFQRLSCASNEDIVAIKEKLLTRAEKYTKEIEPEMRNMKKLKQIIDDYVKGKEIGIKIVMLKEFAKDLEIILNRYK